MLKLSTADLKSLKSFLLSAALIGFTFFAFASIGGDKNKSKSTSVKAGFSPLKTASGFTLKSGLNYRGSVILSQQKSDKYITYTSLVTYQKGNTTYILPNKYKVYLEPSATRSSLQLLNLHFKICK